MTVRRRFWLEVGSGVISAGLAVVTLIWHDWIELVFGLDPDRGNGALEWLIVILAMACAISLAVAARAEWRTTNNAGAAMPAVQWSRDHS